MTTLTEGIAFTLYMGAANFDATEDQRDLMRSAIEPALLHYVNTGDETPVRTIIQIVMGDQWKPTGQWADYIASLT